MQRLNSRKVKGSPNTSESLVDELKSNYSKKEFRLEEENAKSFQTQLRTSSSFIGKFWMGNPSGRLPSMEAKLSVRHT